MNAALRGLYLCLAVTYILLDDAHACQSNTDKDCSWTALVMFENDLFADQDEQYTSGIKFGWISPDLTRYRDSDNLPSWLLPLIDRVPLINDPSLQRNVEFYLGQKIFTPIDTDARELVRNDRPYGGWLYAGFGFHNKNARILDAFHLQIGVTGDLSLAEDTQNFVHDLRDLPKINGWDNQLESEPGVVLYFERKWRAFSYESPGGLGADMITHAGAALGNIYTYAATGAEFRFGLNIPGDFGTSLIRPGGDSNAPSDPTNRFDHREFGIYGFAAVSGRAVGRDIFLDGNTFADSHSVDKKNFVGDVIVGASIRYLGVKLSYAQVFRSREFDAQPDGHEFGSLSLSFTF